MNEQIAVISQKPINLVIGGEELTLHPPTLYRIDQLSSAGITEVVTGEDQLPDKSDKESWNRIFAILKIACRGRDRMVGGVFTEGTTPEPFDKDDFWMKIASVPEIIDLLDKYVSMIDVGKLLKNALMLKGLTARQ